MKNIFKITCLFLLVCFVACSDDENVGGTVSNEPLKGSVFGETFVALGGKAFDSGENVSINITNEVTAVCSSSVLDYNLYISATVPAKVGVYENTNVSFHKEGETPLNVLQSTVEITSVTDSQIMVKVKSNSSSDNVVDGLFTVAYCN
ncbi:hypothetical protein [Tenacibaculum sp. M341]|uniref:hypothetical protein n=1 Tax=Tenacibaculum sp. M341 TaxID=2530339 RepID=UPI00104839FE|nr:hypothetical protein [Tenacibaculum sp. M341]TCI93063.1 hypothetical protein EYW44_05445 [Tenacibaculum sp. M341]